jgi:hypothetical protein
VSPLLREMGFSAARDLGYPPPARRGIRPETCGTRPQRKWPRIGGAIKRGAALCQLLVSCDHSGGVKLLGEIISAFSPQNSSSTEKGVWTRRESNLRRLRGVQAACRNPERSEGPLHFDREPCYRCTTGPKRSLCDGGADSKRVISNFLARVPNWDESLRWYRDFAGDTSCRQFRIPAMPPGGTDMAQRAASDSRAARRRRTSS